MSGLAALIGSRSDAEAVRRMLLTASWRGEVVELACGEGKSLGAQSRPDEDPFCAGAVYQDPRIAVAFTGCLYQGDGIVSGTEAAKRIAETYLRGGAPEAARCDGAFAAVIVSADGRIAAARSRMGERPLFWSFDGGMFAAASEIKQLLAGLPVNPPADVDAALDVVAGRFDDLARTLYLGVSRLEPSGWLELQAGTVRRGIVWRPEQVFGSRRIKPEDAAVEFRARLRTAVARRLREGTAVMLSGGLDSPAVAAEAAPLHLRRYGTRLRAVSATYPGFPGVDESPYVGEIAEQLKIEVMWTKPHPRPFAHLDFEAQLHDGPSILPMGDNLHQILRAAREAGMVSLLDGHDGDSLFGRTAGLGAELLRRGRLGVFVRHIKHFHRTRGQGWSDTMRRTVLPASLDALPGARRLWTMVRGRGSISPTFDWLQEPLRSRMELRSLPRYPDSSFRADLAHVHVGFEFLDRVAQREGVDLLHPLADADVASFVWSLGPEVRFSTGASKSPIRAGYPELPASVRARGKMLFNDVAEAGASSEEILAEVKNGPRLFSGVDWGRLERRLQGGEMAFAERACVGRVLSADRWLATKSC